MIVTFKRNWFVIVLAIVAAFGAMALADPPGAKADTVSGCEVTRGIWLFKGTVRSICDGERRPDGSWLRGREFWTPAHYVPYTSYCNRYSCTGSGGYYQERTSNGVETYIVFDSNVLPDEPGHLVNGVRG